MIDIVLLILRWLLVAFLFLFLFIVMKTGIGLVKGVRKTGAVWTVMVERGPRELRGVHLNVQSPIVVGRSPGADIVIGTGYVSSRHARFSPVGADLVIEDLGSTNGTMVNGEFLDGPMALNPGDVVSIGDVNIRVSRH